MESPTASTPVVCNCETCEYRRARGLPLLKLHPGCLLPDPGSEPSLSLSELMGPEPGELATGSEVELDISTSIFVVVHWIDGRSYAVFECDEAPRFNYNYHHPFLILHATTQDDTFAHHHIQLAQTRRVVIYPVGSSPEFS